MIAAIRRRLDNEDEGFTLIELLVVVIIIGILAAIAIPTFLNQRERGWEAAAQSDLRNAAIAMESYAVGNNGSYLNATIPLLEDEGFNNSAAVTFAIVSATAEAYSLSAEHDSGGDSFTLNSTDGEVTRVTTP